MMARQPIGVVEDTRFAPVATDDFGRAAFIRVHVPPGPETLWPEIVKRGLKGPFTALEISAPLNVAQQVVEDYLARCRAAGHVTLQGETTARQSLFTLTSKRVMPPQVNRRGEADHTFEITARIWRAVRMIKTFSIDTLNASLFDASFPIPRETVGRYVQALADAGYLQDNGAEKALGQKRYVLKPHMDTKGLPPRLMVAHLIYDPNRQAIAGHSVMAREVRL